MSSSVLGNPACQMLPCKVSPCSQIASCWRKTITQTHFAQLDSFGKDKEGWRIHHSRYAPIAQLQPFRTLMILKRNFCLIEIEKDWGERRFGIYIGGESSLTSTFQCIHIALNHQ